MKIYDFNNIRIKNHRVFLSLVTSKEREEGEVLNLFYNPCSIISDVRKKEPRRNRMVVTTDINIIYLTLSFYRLTN